MAKELCNTSIYTIIVAKVQNKFGIHKFCLKKVNKKAKIYKISKKREVQNSEPLKNGGEFSRSLIPSIGVMAGARYRSHIRMASSSTIPLVGEGGSRIKKESPKISLRALKNGGEFSRSLMSSHKRYGWRSLSKPYTDGFFIYYPTCGRGR